MPITNLCIIRNAIVMLQINNDIPIMYKMS